MATTHQWTCGNGTWPSPFTFFADIGHNGIVKMGHYSHSPSPCFPTLATGWHGARWFTNHTTLLDDKPADKPKPMSLTRFSIPSTPIYDIHLRLQHPPSTNTISTRKNVSPFVLLKRPEPQRVSSRIEQVQGGSSGD
jgi:hypothetical protein